MVMTDPEPARQLVTKPLPDGVVVERLGGISGPSAELAAGSIVEVLADAFDVGDTRIPGVTAETIASLGRAAFTHYLARSDGRPVAVARRATFDGVSYLSSIGTAGSARGRGFGRLVTATAACESVDAGSDWTHLGVFVDNSDAIRLYEGLGFERIGEPCPDLLLV
jgi:ribosomal protein S18 acetylase RimI-like enzyme